MKISILFFIGLMFLISIGFSVTNIGACTNLSTSGETYQLNQPFNGTTTNCLNITAPDLTLNGQNNEVTSQYFTISLGNTVYTNNVILSNFSLNVINFVTGQYAEPIFAISNNSNFTNILIRNIGYNNASLANDGTFSQIGSEDAVLVFKSFIFNDTYSVLPPSGSTPFKLSGLKLSNMSLLNISIDRDFGGGGATFGMQSTMLFGAQTNNQPSIIDSNLTYDFITLNNITFQNINSSSKIFYFAQLVGNQAQSTDATKFQVSNIQADSLNFININDNATGSSTRSFAKTSIIAAVSQFYPILLENISITNVNFTNITNYNGFRLLNPAIIRYHSPIFGNDPSAGFTGTRLQVNNLYIENISSDSIPVLFQVAHPTFVGSTQNFSFRNITFKQRKPFNTIAIYDFFLSGDPQFNSIQNYNFSLDYTNGQHINTIFNISNDDSQFLINDIKDNLGNLLGYNQTNVVDLNTVFNASWSRTSTPNMDVAISFPDPPAGITKTAIKLRRFILGGTPNTPGSWVNDPQVPDSVYWQNITIDTTNNLFIIHNQTAATLASDNALYALQIEAVKVTLNSPGGGATAGTTIANVSLNWTCYGVFPSYGANITFDGALVGINNISLNNTPQNLTVSATTGTHLWDVNCFNSTYYINSNQTFQISSGGGGGGGGGGGVYPQPPTNTTKPPIPIPPKITDQWLADALVSFFPTLLSKANFACTPFFQINFDFFGLGIILDRIICEFRGLLSVFVTNVRCVNIVLLLLLLLLVASKQNKKKEKPFFWAIIAFVGLCLILALDILLYFVVVSITFIKDTGTQLLFPPSVGGTPK